VTSTKPVRRLRRTGLAFALLLALSTVGVVTVGAQPAMAAAPTVYAPWDSGVQMVVGNPAGSGGGGFYGHNSYDYYAVDINKANGANDCGMNVRATAAGSVVFSDWDGGGGGNMIVINHGRGYTSSYQHLQDRLVSSGTVTRGQIIGTIGTTGNSTGCHLHFVLREGAGASPTQWSGTSIPPSPMSGVSLTSPGNYVTSDNSTTTTYDSLAGDFNEDGVADLVLRDTSSGMIYIRFGPGYGTQIAHQWAPGTYFQFFAGNFNGTGGDDLALRDVGTGNIYIRYASATGFGGDTMYSWAPGSYFQVVAGNFNGTTGPADLALRDTGTGTIYIRYGDGSGSFSGYGTHSWAPGTYFQMLAGNFNASNTPDDLALRDTSAGVIYFRYGDGAGNFSGYTTHSWAPGTYLQPIVGNFDGGATPDDLALRDKTTGTFYFRYNNGSGSFGSDSSYNWPAVG